MIGLKKQQKHVFVPDPVMSVSTACTADPSPTCPADHLAAEPDVLVGRKERSVQRAVHPALQHLSDVRHLVRTPGT
jgi:hypothetical protein